MVIDRDPVRGDALLSGLPATGLCTDPEVVKFLKENPGLSALVTKEGMVLSEARERSERRLQRALSRLVEKRLGPERPQAGHVRAVGVSGVARWKARNKPKSVDERQEAAAKAAAADGEANLLLMEVFDAAIAAKASDVYIDLSKAANRARIGHRIYGRKIVADELAYEQGLSLCRSLWTMSATGQFEEAKACDCAVDHFVALPGEARRSKKYRIRANSVKDIVGNSVVCRIRDPKFVLPLDAAGYSPRQREHIDAVSESPGGLLLITGETNSGKSTTAATLMADLPDTQKIIEIADPVEVVFDHVTHIEINRYHKDADRIFKETLAATVRQNPDTLVLGEIRDQMTADAAMSMAIQGKRVISTVHTQSCTAALPRLKHLGVEESLLSLPEFVAGLVNQNLVPRVCTNCALKAHPDRRREGRYRRLFGDRARHINPAGCEQCVGGVVGQTLVAEVYPLCLDRKGEAHALIAKKDFVGLERHVRQVFGVVSKHEHAKEKVLAGEIDAESTERTIGTFLEDEDAEAAARLVQLESAAG